MTTLRLFCAVAVALVAPMALRADVVFSDLTTPNGGGYVVCGSASEICLSSSESISVGGAFTPAANYLMTEAQVSTAARDFISGDNANFDAYLYADSTGIPGSQLAVLGTDLTAPSGGGLNMINLGTPVALISGTQYWVVLTPVDAHSSLAWNTLGSASVPIAFENNGGAWSGGGDDTLQFEIDGTPLAATPEPTTLFVPLLALLGTVALVRRNQWFANLFQARE